MTNFAAAVFPLVAALSMVACQPDSAAEAPGVSADRPVVDALDRDTAVHRKKMVSNLGYDLFIDLAGSTEEFSGEVTASFDVAEAARDLTLDFGGGNVGEVRINGLEAEVDYNGFFLTLPAGQLRSGRNTVYVAFTHDFDEDGTGLHRFVDPEDGLTYLYTYLWPYYANRLFPSFDQPNLKAEVSLLVRAPDDWLVVSMGRGEQEMSGDGSSLWRFTATPKLPLYAFSLHAGPYVVWEDDADGIPIRLMARQSLAEHVAVKEWFDVTKRGLEYFGEYFDIPYPFEKYDQLIVPDFNIGAMENTAAVTFSEGYVQRQRSNRQQREQRTSTILHEMAHMWFGDLVTHDWWNGMWLNESFATQMAAMAEVATTEFDDAWHGFFTEDKPAAYARDSRVTTHPIEMPIASTAEFFTIFDAITYQKGSSVLKQLAHFVGEENYRRAVSSYLKEFAYGTTELADFIRHQEMASNRDLQGWTDEWLTKAGFNTLRASVECDADRLHVINILQTAPVAHPYLRTHQVDVALYNLDADGRLTTSVVLPVEVAGATTAVDFPEGQPCPRLVNPNHDDWAYARVLINDADMEALGELHAGIPDPLARSIFLTAIYDRAMAGEIPIAEFVDHAMRLAEHEDNVRIQQQIARLLVAAVDIMERLSPQTDAAMKRVIPALERESLDRARTATTEDLRLLWFDTFMSIVSSEAGLGFARNLLEGDPTFGDIEISADVRWRLLAVLSKRGATDINDLLEFEAKVDPSDFGAKSLMFARATRPDIAEKARWLREVQNPETVTGLARQRAVMAGLFPANQASIQLELLDDVLGELPRLSASTDPYFLSSYTTMLLQPMCTPESVAKMASALENDAGELSSVSLRFLREAHQADSECLALRDVQG